MQKFNTNQKIIISLIASPILVYLLIGFLTTDFDITKWGITSRGASLFFMIFAYVWIFAFLDSFKQNKNK